ncbi:MAG: 50S ribosomal protein L28 [Treponema sp.]|nr:MAG: 50S ribosomal protein L28 [Treponema sp.]
MSRRCEICGKGAMSGNKVSKAYNHSRRVWKPNIISVKTELGGTTMHIKMCTRCLKTGYVTKKV